MLESHRRVARENKYSSTASPGEVISKSKRKGTLRRIFLGVVSTPMKKTPGLVPGGF
jgi:hypothetical protein